VWTFDEETCEWECVDVCKIICPEDDIIPPPVEDVEDPESCPVSWEDYSKLVEKVKIIEGVLNVKNHKVGSYGKTIDEIQGEIVKIYD